LWLVFLFQPSCPTTIQTSSRLSGALLLLIEREPPALLPLDLIALLLAVTFAARQRHCDLTQRAMEPKGSGSDGGKQRRRLPQTPNTTPAKARTPSVSSASTPSSVGDERKKRKEKEKELGARKEK
jgi:hypothetical protein